jgi:predicted nucleic acid-binding protein
VTLVDANILMYSAGAEHPNKAPSIAFLERVAAGEIQATIDAEVLQEIMHRYRSLGRWHDGRKVYELARRLFPQVLAITVEVMDRAKPIIDQDSTISARDAIHAAVVINYKLDGICSFDADFDRIPNCKRMGM